jgi:hypothetical protein
VDTVAKALGAYEERLEDIRVNKTWITEEEVNDV